MKSLKNCKTVITGMEEVKGDIESSRFVCLGELGEFRNITNHFSIAAILTEFAGKFVPDVHPIAILFVNFGSTDIKFDTWDKSMTDFGNPAPFLAGITRITTAKNNTKIYISYKITIALKSSWYFTSEVSSTWECLFNAFYSKIGVSSVNDFEKSNLRITG